MLPGTVQEGNPAPAVATRGRWQGIGQPPTASTRSAPTGTYLHVDGGRRCDQCRVLVGAILTDLCDEWQATDRRACLGSRAHLVLGRSGGSGEDGAVVFLVGGLDDRV